MTTAAAASDDPSHSSTATRIANCASTLAFDSQSIIAEIRKAISVTRAIAVDLEKEHMPEKVEELEAAVLELLEAYNGCAHFSDAIRAIGSKYQPPTGQQTDFSKLIQEEVAKSKQKSPFVPQNHQLYRQFKQAIWNVHHSGQPMPGEEQEDLIMTSTQNNLLNIICPLTGKPVTELKDPVRCMDCKHIYEKDPIIHYIRTKKPHPQCPVAGCPRILQEGRVECDAMLPVEIEEMRSAQPTNFNAVEDFTELDDE